jgi:large subunit ribosomal protein L9e
MMKGVTVVNSPAQKDELVLQGNDIEAVSQSGMLTSKLLFVYNTYLHLFFLQLHSSNSVLRSRTRTSESFLMASTSLKNQL